MLFMDLVLNGVTVFTGLPVFGQKLMKNTPYLGYSGGFMAVDTEGLLDPSFDGLSSRYLFTYFSSTPGTPTPRVLPVQNTSVQNFASTLDNQNFAFGLYDMTIDTALPEGESLPDGADAGYIRQQFLLTSIGQYADLYATDYYQQVQP